MKLERLLRSPFLNVFFIVLLGTVMILTEYKDPYMQALTGLFALLVLFFALIWFILILFHNRRNPERRIRLCTFTPPEIREDDEGLKHLTMQAARKTYTMFYTGIPLSLILIFWFRGSIIVPVICLCILGILQQLIYWLELRKWDQE